MEDRLRLCDEWTFAIVRSMHFAWAGFFCSTDVAILSAQLRTLHGCSQ